jgi:hypothetical protein
MSLVMQFYYKGRRKKPAARDNPCTVAALLEEDKKPAAGDNPCTVATLLEEDKKPAACDNPCTVATLLEEDKKPAACDNPCTVATLLEEDKKPAACDNPCTACITVNASKANKKQKNTQKRSILRDCFADGSVNVDPFIGEKVAFGCQSAVVMDFEAIHQKEF